MNFIDGGKARLDAPMSISIEFVSPGGRAITYGDLGDEFQKQNIWARTDSEPFRINIDRQTSAKGNYYYSWDLNGVQFPDGFSTCVRIEGVTIPPGVLAESKRGNQMRQDKGEIQLNGIPYMAAVTIVKGRRPYWVKVVVHKKPNPGSRKKKVSAEAK